MRLQFNRIVHLSERILTHFVQQDKYFCRTNQYNHIMKIRTIINGFIKSVTAVAGCFLFSMCMSCSSKDDIPEEKGESKIDVSSYATSKAYQSGAPENYTYDAKVSGDSIYIHMVQHFTQAQQDAHVQADIMDESLLGADVPLKVCAYRSGTCVIQENECIAGHSLTVKTEGTSVEYLIKIKCSKTPSEKTRIKFYSYDPEKKGRYNAHDFIVSSEGAKLHTHAGKGWFVTSRIGFKPESLYPLPEKAQGPLPDKWGYAASAEDEGLYIYAYQNHDYVEGANKWKESSHMEFSLWQHNMGYGPTHGFGMETYIALWKSGDIYLNNTTNVLGHELVTTLKDGRTEYRYFIRFNNNHENPKDGPYAMLKARSYDPGDERKPYSYDDIVEFRDDRFVHTVKGSNYLFNRTLNVVNNQFENEWLGNKINDFKKNGLEGKKNLTLFIGDSFFDVGWWKNFYTDYQGKAAHTAAIGGTTTWQWLNWTKSIVKTFDENLKNIVIHLGYNDLNLTKSGVTAQEIEFYTERFIDLLHSTYPDVNIYYFSIGTSEWFVINPETRAKECDALAKAFCESRNYVTYVDMDAAYKKYMDETGGSLESFFKDNTHPKDENYKYLMEQLELAGCVIE